MKLKALAFLLVSIFVLNSSYAQQASYEMKQDHEAKIAYGDVCNFCVRNLVNFHCLQDLQ